MTSSGDLRQIVQSFYDLCQRGEWARVETMLTDDFYLTEAPGLPFAGVYRGRRALREVFERVFTMLDIAGLDVHDIAVGENHAVGVLDMVLAGTPPVRVAITEVFRFRAGKVCEIRPHYFDTSVIVAAVAARRAAR
ncbi:MAG TPA: nuclear transport factor 2 family protein [Steroidobacteraceae bacterium]|nr:nuclear transport factor 2 family protein [Steroidobacteraceae bacterium]